MLQLRKANVTDYQLCKELYEEDKYQWMYFPHNIEDSVDRIFDEIVDYSFEKFEKDLKTYKIFMIEENGNVLGNLRIFYSGYGTYKLEDWSMFENNDSVKRKVVKELMKNLSSTRFKRITVHVTYEVAREFLKSVGFSSYNSTQFLELKLYKN